MQHNGKILSLRAVIGALLAVAAIVGTYVVGWNALHGRDAAMAGDTVAPVTVAEVIAEGTVPSAPPMAPTPPPAIGPDGSVAAPTDTAEPGPVPADVAPGVPPMVPPRP